MASRIYCGCDLTLIPQYVVDDDIIIYGDDEHNSIDREFMMAISTYRSSIHSIVLEQISEIKENTFRSLSALSNVSIQLGEDLMSIGSYAFADNSAFRYIKIPNNVSILGDYIFQGCGSINVVELEEPCKLTKIPVGTFQGCNALNNIITSNTTEESTSEFPPSITVIEQYAFQGCGSFTGTLKISDNITNIKTSAFQNCNALSTVIFGTGLEKGSSGGTIDPLLPPKNIFLTSQRQFRYQHLDITATSDPHVISLNDEFKYCPYESHFMVFRNRRLLPQGTVYSHSKNDTPLYRPELYCDIELQAGDVIDIFYITNGLQKLNRNVSNFIGHNTYDSVRWTGYIRFVSPLYEVSSRNSTFIFINGKKIPRTSLEDISDTVIKVMSEGTSTTPIEIYSYMDNLTPNKSIFIKDGLTHEKDKIKTIDLTQLHSFELPCKLDELLNHSTDEQLNTLFLNHHTLPADTPINTDITSRQALLGMIFDDYSIPGDADWTINI